MKLRTLAVSVAMALSSLAATAGPMVGGSEMHANRDIIDNAVNSQDHTTLVAAVKAADLVPTLKGAGPFTVFAPTNAAFAELPPKALEGLLLPENKAMLSKVLTYHVVAGKMDTAALRGAVAAGNGKATLKTVEGESLTVTAHGDRLAITDVRGNVAHITIADVEQSNGVIQVVDKVLMPAHAAPRTAALTRRTTPLDLGPRDPNNLGGA